MIINKIKKGFTIIELLVVVVIIGLLTTVATTSYMNAQKKARDNARKTQINNIANAVETYYAAKRKLPGYAWSEYSSSPTLKGLSASSADVRAKCIMPVPLTGSTAGAMAFYYYPFNNTSNWCGTASSDTSYIPSDYAPYPMWIPGMGQYLSSVPVEKNYKGGDGSSIGLLGNPFSASAPNNGECTSGQCSQTYVYIKLDTSGHYLVTTRLEVSDSDTVSGAQNYGGHNVDISGTNIYVVGK